MTPEERWNLRIEALPLAWRGAVVDIIDTFETAQIGLTAVLGYTPTDAVIVEVVKMIVQEKNRDNYSQRNPYSRGDT